MKKKLVGAITMILTLVLLLMTFGGCGKSNVAPDPTKPVSNDEPVSPTENTEPSETEPFIERQDGERFETVIILEGMEELVHYEHVRNDTLGFEMDYDYELFVRHSEPDREWFVSSWDDPNNPENYIEVEYNNLDAETVAASISEQLSNDYEISRNDSFMLDRAGRCIRIDASADKSGLTMPEHLQMVYIIPADDGCRIATAHYAIEASEGFGRRFHYFMDTFSVIAGQG